MKTTSISTRLSIILGLVILIAIAIITLLNTVSSTKIAKKNAQEEMHAILSNTGQKIEYTINEHISQIEGHWLDLNVLSAKPGFIRTDLQDIYKRKIEESPDIIGYTVCMEPNMFDGKDEEYAGYPGYYDDGRFSEYWFREEGQILRDDIVTNFDDELIEAGADWWEVPKATGENYVYMDLYKVVDDYVLMLSISVPLKRNNIFAGVICKDFISEFIQQEALKAQARLFDGRSQITIFDQDGFIAADTRTPENIGKEISDIDPENYKEILESIQAGTESTLNADKNYITILPVQFRGTSSKWQIRAEVEKSVINETTREQLIRQVFVGLFALGLIIVLIIVLIRFYLNPLKKISVIASEIAEGKLEHKIEINSRDEIGQLSEAFSVMIEKLKTVISQVRQSSYELSNAGQQVNNTSQTMSQGASEQASSVEEISSTMEQIASNIEQNTDNAKQTEQISNEANDGINKVANQSGLAVEANQNIADKISIINDIAFQTNILALNAAVEAARAGEHGKGFAVVAAEVRKLAERSKIAADEIVSLAESGLQLSEGAGNIMNEVLPKIQSTTKLVQEIAAASMEQNNGAGQVNNAIQQLNNVTQQNASSSEMLATNAEELAAQAEQLKEIISFFKTGDEQDHMALSGFQKKSVTEPAKNISVDKPISNSGTKIDLRSSETDNDFESF